MHTLCIHTIVYIIILSIPLHDVIRRGHGSHLPFRKRPSAPRPSLRVAVSGVLPPTPELRVKQECAVREALGGALHSALPTRRQQMGFMFYLPRPSAKGHNGIIRCETTSELSFQTTSTKKKEKKKILEYFFFFLVLFSTDQCIDIDGYVYMVNSTDLCNKLLGALCHYY